MMWRVILSAPYKWKKIDKVMRIEGVALATGTFRGIDGRKVKYSAEVLKESAGSLLAKPILYAHTTNGEDVKHLSVGFVSGVKPEEGVLTYEGYIYNPTVFPFIEEELKAVSPELDVEADYNPNEDVFEAQRIHFTGLALTNHPACKEAIHQGYEYVTQIKMEEKNMAEELAEYPMPKTKAWGDMTDTEKFESCRVFFQRKGYGLPSKAEDIDEFLGKLEEFICPVCKARYKEWADFFKHWNQKHRDEYGVFKKKGEEMEANLQEELETLKKQVEYFQTREIQRLEENIKNIDKAFKLSELAKDVKDYETKRTLLEQYLRFISEHKPKVKLEVSEELTGLEAIEKQFLSKLSPELRVLLEENKQ